MEAKGRAVEVGSPGRVLRVFRHGLTGVLLLAWGVGHVAQGSPELDRAERAALVALERYLETWNTRLPEDWASSLHFPHVRPSAGRFRLTRTPHEYAATVDFERTLASGWHRSQWDAFRVLHVDLDKVHVAGTYTRYRENGETLFTALVTYVVTNRNGHWGIQARFGAGRLGLDEAAQGVSTAGARRAIDAYFEALNRPTDVEAWVRTMHFPQVLVADGTLTLWADATAFEAGPEPGRLRTWFRTRVIDVEAVQVGANAVNAVVRYDLENPQGEAISSRDAVFLLTRRDDGWKVQARSELWTAVR